MGSKTPPSIKKEVIKLWLKCRQEDPDFDLLREVAVIIKNESMNLAFAASSIRLKRILEDNGLHEEQLESFVEKIEVHCFKRSLDFGEFINLIFQISNISNNLDVSIDSLPKFVSQKKEDLYGIVSKVTDMELEIQDLIKEKKVTMDILSDYEKDRPVAENLAATKRELEAIKKERDSLEDEIIAKGREIHKMNYEQMIPLGEVEMLNKKLDVPIDDKELSELMLDFRQHLCLYSDVITILRERRRYPSFDMNKYLLSLFKPKQSINEKDSVP